MFRGRFVHAIDAKGRVSIPAGLRMELQRRSERTPIVAAMRDCLWLMGADDWATVETKLLGLDMFQPEGQSLQRFVLSGASECELDVQGRILIPTYLRVHAKLDKEVAIAGVGNRIELWDRRRFDDDLAHTQVDYREIFREISKHGN